MKTWPVLAGTFRVPTPQRGLPGPYAHAAGRWLGPIGAQIRRFHPSAAEPVPRCVITTLHFAWVNREWGQNRPPLLALFETSGGSANVRWPGNQNRFPDRSPYG